VRLAEERSGEARDVEPADLLAALREEGGSLAAEILRRASGAVNVPSAGD
jgi:lambda repressor-like predicted transcriptional regulator